MPFIQRYKYELFTTIILVSFVGFKWNDLFLPYIWDGLAYYAKAGLYMFDNKLSLLPNGLPPDLSRGHPLLFHFALGLWFKVFGTDLFSGHVFALILSIVYLLTSFILCFRVSSSKLTSLVAVIILIIQPVFLAQSALILPEIMLGIWLNLALYYLLKKKHLKVLVFSTLLVFTKETAVVLSVGMGLWLIVINKNQKEGVKQMLIPTTALILFFIIQKSQNGWFFFPFHVELVQLNPFDFVMNLLKSIYFLFISQGRFIYLPFIALLIYRNSLSVNHQLLITLIILYVGVNSAYYVMNRYFMVVLPLIAIVISGGVSQIFNARKWSFASVFIFAPLFFLEAKDFNIDVDLGYRNCIKATQSAYEYLANSKLKSKNGYCHFSIKRAFDDNRLGYNDQYIDFKMTNERSTDVEYAIEINPQGWNRNLEYWKEFRLAKTIKEGNFEILIFTK